MRLSLCESRGGLLAASLLLLSPVLAAAEGEARPLGEAIEVGDNRCMGRDELVPNVELWLGRSSIDERIRIVVQQLDDDTLGFVVSREGRPAAERRFRTNQVPCGDLRSAVALAIALAIDATILRGIEEPVPPPTEPSPPAAKPPSKRSEPRPAPVRRARPKSASEPARPSLQAEAHMLGLFGVLPAPAWGGSLGVAVPLGGAFALRAAGWATARADVPVGRANARVAMAAGELGLCLDRPLDDGTVRGCAGAAAGRWSARGYGFTFDRSTELPWAAGVADLGLELPISGGVAFSTRISGYLPLLRPVLEEREPGGTAIGTAEAPPAGGAVRAGVSVTFP